MGGGGIPGRFNHNDALRSGEGYGVLRGGEIHVLLWRLHLDGLVKVVDRNGYKGVDLPVSLKIEPDLPGEEVGSPHQHGQNRAFGQGAGTDHSHGVPFRRFQEELIDSRAVLQVDQAGECCVALDRLAQTGGTCQRRKGRQCWRQRPCTRRQGGGLSRRCDRQS